MGISFNYKADNRRAWLYCTIVIFMVLFLTVLTYFMLLRETQLDKFGLVFFVSIRNCIWTFMPMCFITLLQGLRQRYAALNSNLRY